MACWIIRWPSAALLGVTTRSPGGVGEVGLGRLGVVLDRADAAAEGHADGQGHGDPPFVAVAQLGHLRDDLVEGGIDEAVELDLAHRPVAAHGQPDRGPDDPGLGQRRVDHAAVAEVLLQSLGDPEDAAQLPDVLAHEHDLGVALHGPAQPALSALPNDMTWPSRARSSKLAR